MKKKLLGAVLLTILFALSLCVYGKHDLAETFSVNAVTEDEIKNELIIAIFVGNITDHINDFYSQIYSGQIAVYNYEIEIVDISKSNGSISIKFGVTPQIGAHNPLGYDELSYSIDSSGSGKLIDYRHIKDHPIPERFQEYIIKQPNSQ